MKAFVLDASGTLSWCFSDEGTAATDLLRGQAIEGIAIHVPVCWALEVLNALSRAKRRKRIEEQAINVFLDSLLSWNINVDPRTPAELWNDCRWFIDRYQLSAYDAAYLSLAKRRHLPLATLDERLRFVAEGEGVALAL